MQESEWNVWILNFGSREKLLEHEASAQVVLNNKCFREWREVRCCRITHRLLGIKPGHCGRVEILVAVVQKLLVEELVPVHGRAKTVVVNM